MNLLHSLHDFLPAFTRDALRLGLWLALLSILFVPLERLAALRHQRIGRAELGADLFYYFFNSLLRGLLVGVPMAAVALLAQRIIPAAVPMALGALPFAVKLLLAFVIGEVGFYWGHRLSHEIAWLWRFHAVHHQPEHLYFLINTRAHPVDMVFTRVMGLTPLYLLGLGAPGAGASVTPVSIILLGTVWGFFIHANLRWRFGPLEWLIATPAFHHWHHSRVEHTNRNYASMLPVLDRVFGTLHLPPEWPSAYGIAPADQQT